MYMYIYMYIEIFIDTCTLGERGTNAARLRPLSSGGRARPLLFVTSDTEEVETHPYPKGPKYHNTEYVGFLY